MKILETLNIPFQWISCYVFKSHSWTCNAMEGIPMPKDTLTEKKFKEYARMYCKYCGVESELSRKYREGKPVTLDDA